jgi:hypothetical protein
VVLPVLMVLFVALNGKRVTVALVLDIEALAERGV